MRLCEGKSENKCNFSLPANTEKMADIRHTNLPSFVTS